MVMDEVAHALISVPSTVKCASDNRPAARAWPTTASKNLRATSWASSRSRFLVNVVGSNDASSKFISKNQRNKMLYSSISQNSSSERTEYSAISKLGFQQAFRRNRGPSQGAVHGLKGSRQLDQGAASVDALMAPQGWAGGPFV